MHSPFDLADPVTLDIKEVSNQNSAQETRGVSTDIELTTHDASSTLSTGRRPLEALEVDDRPALNGHQDAMQRRRMQIQFAACCWSMFMSGWNDGSLGPLIPTVQSYYHIGYGIVALVFVSNCVGYISGAVGNVFLTNRYGFGKVILLGSVLQTIAFAMQAPAGPFPLFVFSFALDGVGMSLMQGHANTYVGSLESRPRMGVLHSIYGVGALCSPLLATHFATQKYWSFHYLVSTGLSVTNVVCLLTVFRLRRLNDVLIDAGRQPNETGTNGDPKYKQIMGFKVVHLLAAWALVYVGVEFTIGAWTVTYIQHERGGGQATGYISTGFFAGLALGRVGLLWVNHLIGESRAMYLYVSGVIALQVTVWVVPSLIENAVAVAFIGLLLGPMYPILISHIAQVLPRWLLTGAVSWVAGIGTTGSAALPFLTGVLSEKFGIRSLQPLLISMMSVLVGLWAVVPKGQARFD